MGNGEAGSGKASREGDEEFGYGFGFTRLM